MKKATIQRLLDTPGARVTLSNGELRINDKPAQASPWFKNNSVEIGVLLAMPRVGNPMKLDSSDPMALGRFAGPAIFDVFTQPATLRRFLDLKEASIGDYVTPIERDSDGGLVREIVGELRKMMTSKDWKIRFTAGLASAMQDALSNGIPIAGGAGDWARAIIEAAEQ